MQFQCILEELQQFANKDSDELPKTMNILRLLQKLDDGEGAGRLEVRRQRLRQCAPHPGYR